jgi:ABC-type uncharacterized transport system substrate-binding protein
MTGCGIVQATIGVGSKGSMRRRDFIRLAGGAAAVWPLTARAQQPAMPVIGFLNAQSPEGWTEPLRGFRQGLKDTGYVEGENVTIVYRWAEGQFDRLSALAADLVRQQVAVIAAAGGGPSPLAAKAATTTIPIVFLAADDPVKLGLVASLARPGGNLTGVNFFNVELTAKRLELLRELVPGAARVAVLVNPANAPNTETTLQDVEAAARAIGLQIHVLNAGTSREISAAFATFVRERPSALYCMGCGIEPRKIDIAGAESLYSLEGNMCGTAMRGAVALPGSKATSRAKGSHRNLGGLISDPLAMCLNGPRREGEEPTPAMYGGEKSDQARVAMKPTNKAERSAAEFGLEKF